MKLTRRGLVTGAAGVGAAALAPAATAQPTVTVQVVVPAAEEFTEGEGYAGYFLHIGTESTGELNTDEISDCELSEWPPEELDYYNGQLIDRIEEDNRQVPTMIYVGVDAEIDTGSLWVVNREKSCPGEYVGLELEQVGASFDVDGESTDTESVGLPGFGPVATLAGVVAGGVGLARRRDGDAE